MKLILTGIRKPNVLLQKLQHTDVFFEIMDTVRSVVIYINTNGGFNVIGWYKIGVIPDKMLVFKKRTRKKAGNNWNHMDVFQVYTSEVDFISNKL